MKIQVRKIILSVMAMALLVSQASPAMALRAAQPANANEKAALGTALTEGAGAEEKMNAVVWIGPDGISTGLFSRRDGIFGDDRNQPASMGLEEIPVLIPGVGLTPAQRFWQAARSQVINAVDYFGLRPSQVDRVIIARPEALPAGFEEMGDLQLGMELELRFYFGRPISVQIMGQPPTVSASAPVIQRFAAVVALAGQEEKPAYRIPKDRQGSGPVAIVAKVGGTKFHATLADAKGLWEETDVVAAAVPFDGANQDQIFNHWADQIVQTARRANVSADRVIQIHISWPGYFDEEGNLTQPQENIRGIPAGVNMAKQLQARVNQLLSRHPSLGEIQVIGVHDGTGHALGELSPFGAFPGEKSLHLVGPGTGIANRTMVRRNPFLGGPEVDLVANEAPNMLAWDIDRKDYQLVIFDTRGYPLSRATLANGDPNPYYGRQSMEDRTAGPGIARYVVELLRANLTAPAAIDFLDALSIELADKIRTNTELKRNDLDQVMHTTGILATRVNPNLIALTAVAERAYELGVGTAVTIVEYHRHYGEDQYPYPKHIVLAGGVSTIGELYATNFKAGLRARIERYRTEANAPADMPDPQEFVNRVGTSTILDGDRELLAGLLTADQIAAHQKLLESVTPVASLNWLSQLTEHWNAGTPSQAQSDRRGLILDASKNPKVARIAQAMAILMRQENNPFGVEFRLVIFEDQRQPLLDELRQINSEAASILESRIISYAETNDYDEARLLARQQLATLFGYSNPDEMPNTVYGVITDVTPRMAQELNAFFVAGGLQFLTSDAITRLEALFTSA